MKPTKGVALISVLWLVAAMSLVVAGVVGVVKSEIRVVGQQRQMLIHGALADGAILLAVNTLVAQRKDEHARISRVPVSFGGIQLEVWVQPLNGLVDINNAPLALLSDLYRYAGGMQPNQAQALAQATVNVRQTKDPRGTVLAFDSGEDLLQVPGMTYTLYAKFADLITADLRSGSGRINPLAAPLGVLVVLTGGDVNRARNTMTRREADPTGVDSTLFKQELIEMASTRSVRLQAPVSLSDGNVLQRSWTVHLSPDTVSGLPWRVSDRRQWLQVPEA